MNRPGLAPFPKPPPHARRALNRLLKRDPALAAIEAAAGPLPWRTRQPGFGGLLQVIVAQQISNAAAAAIWSRVQAIPGTAEPASLLAVPDEMLRAAGLSRPKILHARALAAAFLDGRLATETLALMDDEAAVATIITVRGLGRWTAEIYLLFALGRPDVFPAGDLALASAAADLMQLETRPTPRVLRDLADTWRPWRGLAARLLWHHWRHIHSRPAFDQLPTP
jgi:DNA-3-methyladenine glycosylase II